MQMKYTVESGVPLPKGKRKPHNYPFSQMSVGDSFKLNGDTPCTVGYLAALFGKTQEPQWKFRVRKAMDGHRCWRIS
jgi:hypothetical protein